MSVLHCEVLLDNPKISYEPGDKLTGRVILTLDVRLLLKAVFLKYTGFADVQWQVLKKLEGRKKSQSSAENEFEQSQDAVSQQSEQHRWEVYANREDFLSTVNYFVGSEEAIPKVIERGTYVYPFTVALPDKCPSSFESPNAHIRYTLEVYIEHKNKRELWYSKQLNVLKPPKLENSNEKELNTNNAQFEIKFAEQLPFLKILEHPMEMLVRLERTHFSANELISIHTQIHNPDKLQLCVISFELQRILRITAAHGHKKTITKYLLAIIAEAVDELGDTRETTSQHLHALRVPQTVPTIDAGECHCLQISYQLSVRVSTRRVRRCLQAKMPITVGASCFEQAGEGQALNMTEQHWQQERKPALSHSMYDLSMSQQRRPSDIAFGEHYLPTSTSRRPSDFLGATAPSAEVTNLSVSMMSLASSTFREADYMPKTKFNADTKKNKGKKEELTFKPKYLYYDMSTAPMLQGHESTENCVRVPDRERN